MTLGQRLLGATFLLAFHVPATAESISTLSTHTHIHGLAVDRSDPAYLLVATHHGLYRVAPDGDANLISVVQDFMGFTPHPSEPNWLFASGHPAGGGNLGFIGSEDGGRTWTEIASGANGPVDFHQMTVSIADPDRIYGAFGALQISRDAGRNWEEVAPLPDRLIDLAASAESADVLYAATERGLFASADVGKNWRPLLESAPVTMIEVGSDGTVYAFVFGQGLASAREGSFDWQLGSHEWDQDFVLHLAIDPSDRDRLFAATNAGEILVSTDGADSWRPYPL